MSSNNKILRIDGLPQAISFLTTFPSTLNSGLNSELESIGSEGAKTMKGKAHKRTQKMANNINSKKTKDLEVTIASPVGYSGYENRRGNPHNFFDQSVDEISNKAKTRVVKKIDSLLGSKGK